MKKITLAALVALLSSPGHALEAGIQENEILFSGRHSDNISVSLSGPDGYSASYEFDGSFASLLASQINEASDGVYHYDAVAVTVIGEEDVLENNGRNQLTRPVVRSITTSGHFRIQSGSFVPKSYVKE